MIAYQCDENGFFVGTVECQRNPVRREAYLLPRNATFSEKPETCNWFSFQDSRWEYREIPIVAPEDSTSEIQLVFSGKPSKEQIKDAIQRLLDML